MRRTEVQSLARGLVSLHREAAQTEEHTSSRWEIANLKFQGGCILAHHLLPAITTTAFERIVHEAYKEALAVYGPAPEPMDSGFAFWHDTLTNDVATRIGKALPRSMRETTNPEPDWHYTGGLQMRMEG